MRAKTVNENINFERGKSIKDTVDIGEHRSAVTLEIGAVSSDGYNKYRLEGYDERKFLQNIKNGMYPSNIGVMSAGESPKGFRQFFLSTELKDYGYKYLKYKDEYYELG